MKRVMLFVSLLVLLSLACSLTGAPAAAPQEGGQTPTAANPPAAAATQPQVQNEAGAAVLLFTIGMHIEPMGETAQGYGGGKGDYHNPQFFQRHVQDILAVTHIVEAHGGRMTIQAQSPFTSAAIESGNSILADLAARGHEIALHFHEDAHLGKNSESLSVQQWCDVMKQEIDLVKQASGVADIRYWSGGNLYPHTYEAAQCAGLDVNSDWKNPQLQETPLELVGVNPWRPAGGTDGTDFSLFTRHDPNGAVVFLPEGQYDTTNFASMRRSDDSGGDEAYFEYLKTQLYASLAAAQAGKVNVFHFTVHPGEFRGDPNQPFAVIERFLTEVVDPLVASGQVQWATFSEMADAYAAAGSPAPAAASNLPVTSASPAAPSPRGSRVTPSLADVTYCTMDGTALKMDLYYPPASGGSPLPIAVYIHGGGWTSGDKAEGAGALEIPALQQAGFLVAAVNYRLAPEYPFPAMIEDVKCAIRSLRAHADEYRLDPNRIGVWGGSAGGHLASLLGAADESAGFDTGEYLEYSSRVQAVVDMFGPADLTVPFEGGYENATGVFNGFDAALASPVTYVTPDDPPFLILHGDSDSLVPLDQSQRLLAALQAAGVPAELVTVTNAGHSFKPINAPISPSRLEITQKVVQFFEEILK